VTGGAAGSLRDGPPRGRRAARIGLERLSLNQATVKHLGLKEAAALCARHDIPAIGLWRDRVAEAGLAEAAAAVRAAGLRVSSLCRGGFFTQADAEGRRAALADNLAAIAEAAELGTNTLVLVCGGLPPGQRDLGLARRMVADAIGELVPEAQRLGVRLGIEALHPMFCADRCVISSLGEAVDLALRFPADAVGVVVDTYHVWWDARLADEIARAGPRIVSYQVCDWVLPLPADTLLGRGHLGDGVIDFGPVTAAVTAAGYHGDVEVEIFNAEIWDAPPDQTAATVRERFATVLGGCLSEERPMRRWRAVAAAGLAVAAGAVLAVAAGRGPAAVPAGPGEPAIRATGGAPPMGWSSWSFLRKHPTAASVEAQAWALKSSGLAAHGYRYVNVDDFWMACDSHGPEVDAYGRWIPDRAAFPGGIAAVARQVHAEGLKFGLYVTPGIPENAVRRNTAIAGTSQRAGQIADPAVTEMNYNCGHMYGLDYGTPAAQRYIDSWAGEFAAWGVDYVKLDGVGTWDVPDIEAWSAALRQTGRPMVLELSSNLAISHAAQWAWMASGWRTGLDIECYACERSGSSYPLTSWSNVASRFGTVARWQPYGGPRGWNDEDSLEIGNGAGDGLTLPERQTMMALWSLAGSPLILGTDLTRLTPADLAILENRAVIAVDQDGIAARRVIDGAGEQVFVKRQPGGVWYAGVFNTDTSAPRTFRVPLARLGIGGAARATDLWTGRSLGTVSGSYTVTIAPGGVSLLSVRPA